MSKLTQDELNSIDIYWDSYNCYGKSRMEKDVKCGDSIDSLLTQYGDTEGLDLPLGFGRKGQAYRDAVLESFPHITATLSDLDKPFNDAKYRYIINLKYGNNEERYVSFCVSGPIDFATDTIWIQPALCAMFWKSNVECPDLKHLHGTLVTIDKRAML